MLLGLAVASVFAGVVVAAASAHGTSWTGLWNGVVAAPSGFAEVHYLALDWPAGARALALTQLLAAVAFYFRRAPAWVMPAIAAFRLVVRSLVLRAPVLGILRRNRAPGLLL